MGCPLLVDVDNAAFHAEFFGAEQCYRTGQDLPLRLLHYPPLQNLCCVPFLNGNRLLQDDGPAIAVLADEVDGGAGDFHAIGQGGLMDVESVKALAAEGGDEGGVDVQNGIGVGVDQLRRQDVHKPCQHHDQQYQTAQPDIFVGGDVCTGPRFAIDAIAAGKQGAISIHRFVQPNTSLTIGRNRRDFHELDKSNLALGEYDRAPRQSAALDAGIDAHRSFRDAHLTLTEDQVKIETARCLGCGASVVDPNKCIGCGVCTTKCEFDAIRLHRDLPECSKMVRSEDKFKAILPYMAKREIKIRFAKKEK